MKALLQSGQFIHGVQRMYKVGKLLGAGSQGEVYEVSSQGQFYALKWYYPSMATQGQLHGLQRLAKIGPPNTCFLWPLEVVQQRGIHGFGYIMPLRPKRFASIVDLMKRKAEPTFLALIDAALSLVDSFNMLHQKQLCYRDISFGNVFFDPQSGEVLICDNDNISFEAETHGAVLGTPRFMAPEIVRGEKLPDVLTDRFSLAILLFYMFMIHHPLEGRLEASIKCFDLPAMRKLYGDKPLFIFDPISTGNRPVAGLQDNAIIYWNLYPNHFKDVFTKAFTKGLRQRQERPSESDWLVALVRLKNSLIKCSCSAENFYNEHHKEDALGRKQHYCWACQKELKVPMRLSLANEELVLTDTTKLYAHQIQQSLPPSLTLSHSPVFAEVTRHPNNPSIKGLKNLSTRAWTVTTSKGVTVEVPQGRSCTLEEGIKINFGATYGVVKS